MLNANISNSFRNAVKLGLFIGIMFVLVGIKSISLVILSQIGDLNSMTSRFGIEFVNLDFMKDFYIGFGLALIAVGIFMIFRNVNLLKKPEKFKISEINYLDERNRFIKSMTRAQPVHKKHDIQLNIIYISYCAYTCSSYFRNV